MQSGPSAILILKSKTDVLGGPALPSTTQVGFSLSHTFLVWLFPAHGTFLGHIRLEPHKPQQIPIDSTVSFGASTRAYTLREKPQTLPSAVKGDEKMGGEDDELKGLLGLPEEETELDVIPCLCHCLCLLGSWFYNM